MPSTPKNTAKVVASTLGACVVVAGLYAWSDLYLGTYLRNFVQGQAMWLLPLLIAIGGGFLISLGINRPHFGGYGSWRERSEETEAKEQAAKRSARIKIVIGTVAAVGGIGAVVWVMFWSGYAADQKYLAAAETTTKSQPQLTERAAWDVANAQAPGAQGTFRGKIVRTAYVADKGVYGSLIRKSGSGSSSYVGVMEQKLEFTGQSKVNVCTFSTSADKRLGGYFGHSMTRALSHIERGLVVDEKDAYGFCDGDTPMVVIPVKKLQGWFPAIQVPAGVAIYNGKTGELKLHKDLTEGAVPGPVYPMSLAQRQREALGALNGTWWQALRGQVGYSDTSSDNGDPNGSNRAELALATAGGDDVFATPLTMRGRSGAIAALGISDAGQVHAGQLNSYTVHELTAARKANSAVQDRLKADYADLPDWAAGMKVFEIAPVSNGTWVASLGQKQNVNYRVRINADGSSCLETASGEKIRCGARRGGTFNTTTPGTPGSSGATDPVELPGDAAALAELTDAQIAQLQKQLTDELVRRINTNK